jgi:hypothetical protein
MSDTRPFNPLHKKNLAASIVEALLERDPVPLGEIPRMSGSGVYAIYYTGSHPAYEPLAEANRQGRWWAPIYVGKAIPKGGRKGSEIVEDESELPKGTELWSRLKEHAESIRLASMSIDIADFCCRFLVVDEIWIPLGENLLISRFMPIWNKHVDGFGNHDPGGGRYHGLIPRWDVLHPGRKWATKCKPRAETSAVIEAEVIDYLRSRAFEQPTRISRAEKPDRS